MQEALATILQAQSGFEPFDYHGSSVYDSSLRDYSIRQQEGIRNGREPGDVMSQPNHLSVDCRYASHRAQAVFSTYCLS